MGEGGVLPLGQGSKGGEPDAREGGMATYYIRQNGASAQGPFEESRISGWIALGRVRADMEISGDGRTWIPVSEHRLGAASPPVATPVAPPPFVRQVQPVEVVEEVEQPVARSSRRPTRRPVARTTPSSGGGLKALAIVVGIGVVGGVGYIALKGEHEIGQSLAEGSARSQAPVATLSAADLLREYEANTLAADAKYKGKALRVSGAVDAVGTDFSGHAYVTLESDSLIFHIQCYFADSHKSEASRFSKGQYVTVRGICIGKPVANVCLEGSTFDSTSAASLAPTGVSEPPASSVKLTVADFRARFETLFDPHEMMRRVPVTEVIAAFGKPDDYKTIAGEPIGLRYQCLDGSMHAAIVGGFVYAFQGGTRAELEAEAKEEQRRKDEQEEAVRQRRTREDDEQRQRDDRDRREREAKEREEAEAQAKRAAQLESAKKRMESAAFAAVSGSYTLLQDTVGWSWVKEEVGGDRGRRAADAAVQYLIELGADRSVRAMLRVSGSIVWQRSGEWFIGKRDDGSLTTLVEDDGQEARVSYVGVVVMLKPEGVGDYMPPEGRMQIEVWADGRDAKATLVGRGIQHLKRIGAPGAAPEASTAPATAADLVGTYEVTPESLGGRQLTFRLVLSKDGTFANTFRSGTKTTQVHRGTWKFEQGRVALEATTLNGSRMRESKTTEVSLDGAELVVEDFRLRKTTK